MMPEYYVTKCVKFQILIEADSEQEAYDMAWDFNEQTEKLNGKRVNVRDYAVEHIEVEEA
tara:strand:- start:413 stop:592 length:180 start_codon:yes stop_codon:yes gene_type:complete